MCRELDVSPADHHLTRPKISRVDREPLRIEENKACDLPTEEKLAVEVDGLRRRRRNSRRVQHPPPRVSSG
jgi:hypothetical protein